MYISDMRQSRVFFANSQDGPLGSLRVAGEQFDSRGVSANPMRVFGTYALVAVTGGEGHYRDALGARRRVAKGDAIMVFPEIPHAYGPPRNGRWDEIYVTFTGPVFDLLRDRGALSPANPVATVGGSFIAKLRELIVPETDAAEPGTVLRFAAMLADAFPTQTPAPAWADHAAARVSEDLERPLDLASVAQTFGLSAEAFRKRFAREMGTPPAKFRRQRRLEVARELVTQTDWPLRRIADSLGFVDEFHFSRTFRATFGTPPSRLRKPETDNL